MPEANLHFFCYFTILTNILVAVTAVFQLVKLRSAMVDQFKKQTIPAAMAAYIVRVLYVLFWIFFAEKNAIRWKDAFAWLRNSFF